MRKQFKNIPIGSIITPCVKRGAATSFKRSAHLRKFTKIHGCGIVRMRDKEFFEEKDQLGYWNIVELGNGPKKYSITSWSKF